MQKAIRRADTGVAGFFALELWASGYRDYVWKRLFTISAEDCYGIITKEIEAEIEDIMGVSEHSEVTKMQPVENEQEEKMHVVEYS